MIDRNQIETPDISLTDNATSQAMLILKNDLSLNGEKFRIQITGKGCDGFTYSVGFTKPHPDDFQFTIGSDQLPVIMDPFSAFYLSKVEVDYIQNFEGELEEEGFVVKSFVQSKFEGKFWLKDEDKIPPLLS